MKRAAGARIGKGGTVACLLALLWALVIAAPAHAAPKYESSEPSEGSSVQTAPASVSVSFNEPLDDSSTLWVDNECGDGVDGGNTTVELRDMRIDVTEGHYSGTYTVHYIAVGVGGVTGKTEGAFTFDVAEGHPCGDHKKKHQHKNKNEHDHDKKDHDGHGGHKNDHDGHGGHGGDHGSMDHGTDHSAMDHGATPMDHSAMGSHSDATHENGSKHSTHSGNGSAEHEGHGTAGGSLASGPSLPVLPPNGKTVLLALLLCAGMGVVGGVFLRNAG